MSKTIPYILAFLLVFSVTLFPEIKLKEGLPSFQLIDALLPFIVLVIYWQFKQVHYYSLYGWIILFCIYILFTIGYNGRLSCVRDYFEIYKLIKFLLIIVFFSSITLENVKKIIFIPVFVCLVIVNLIHYFNLFDFNQVLLDYYNGGIHIKTFGLNSLGQPGTKRMVGLIGNPNNNAILFLFFTILFLPKKEEKAKGFILFFIAVLMVFLCQSRTGFIAFGAVLLVGAFLNSYRFVSVVKVSLSVGLAYGLSFILSSNLYMGTLFTQNMMQSTSLRGRFESWMHLWEMIKQKPFFGHAPYKEYFYENKLHSENEYILMTWRYGFIGLFIYLGFLAHVFFKGLKSKSNPYSVSVILFTIVIGITAVTNNPLSDRTILVLFGVLLGLLLKDKMKSYA